MPEPEPDDTVKDYRDRCEELTGVSLWECPVCRHGRMIQVEVLNPVLRVQPSRTPHDADPPSPQKFRADRLAATRPRVGCLPALRTLV